MTNSSGQTRNPVYLGLDIGGSFVKYGVVNSDGTVLFSSRTPTLLDGGPQRLIDTLHRVILEMAEHSVSRGFRPQAIGIGSPGTINPRSGKITGESPNLPGWVNVELRTPFAEFGLPIAVDNDANCSAYAEYTYGAASGSRHALVLTLGTGIGSGIIIDGRLFHGAHYTGAELGHISINSRGPSCGCGNRGCLELYASAGAILRRAARLADFYPHSALAHIDFSAREDSSLAGVFSAARDGDPAAVELLETVADDLAVGLASIINAFDPEVLVVGGGAADAAPEFIADVFRRTKRLTFKNSAPKTKLVPAKLGNRAGFIGAAALGRDAAERP
jgi:glucokinase